MVVSGGGVAAGVPVAGDLPPRTFDGLFPPAFRTPRPFDERSLGLERALEVVCAADGFGGAGVEEVPFAGGVFAGGGSVGCLVEPLDGDGAHQVASVGLGLMVTGRVPVRARHTLLHWVRSHHSTQ